MLRNVHICRARDSVQHARLPQVRIDTCAKNLCVETWYLREKKTCNRKPRFLGLDFLNCLDELWDTTWNPRGFHCSSWDSRFCKRQFLKPTQINLKRDSVCQYSSGLPQWNRMFCYWIVFSESKFCGVFCFLMSFRAGLKGKVEDERRRESPVPWTTDLM